MELAERTVVSIFEDKDTHCSLDWEQTDYQLILKNEYISSFTYYIRGKVTSITNFSENELLLSLF